MRDDFIVGDSYVHGLELHGKDEINLDNPKIAYMLKRVTGKSVLDLGCVQHGRDAFLNKDWLHKAINMHAASCKGLDLYEAGVNHLNTEGYDVIYGDAQDFDLKKKYEVIVAGDLIEHLENFTGFFNSVSKNLANNGSLLIATPNPWHWKRCIKGFLGKKIAVNPEHTCWFCPETLRLLAGRHNFEVVNVEYGSNRKKDAIVPLPSVVKHQSFYAELKMK